MPFVHFRYFPYLCQARMKLVSIRISFLLFFQIILDNFKMIMNDVFLAFNEKVLILQLLILPNAKVINFP